DVYPGLINHHAWWKARDGDEFGFDDENRAPGLLFHILEGCFARKAADFHRAALIQGLHRQIGVNRPAVSDFFPSTRAVLEIIVWGARLQIGYQLQCLLFNTINSVAVQREYLLPVLSGRDDDGTAARENF